MPAVESDVPPPNDVDDQAEARSSASASATQIRRRTCVVVGEPRPERDEERREVLDQERDADREPVDREEVEPLHEREPADPEDARGTAARGASGGAGRAP